MAVDPDRATKLKAAAALHRAWESTRDELVVEAVQAGGSLREVAALVGLSHAGVARIVERAKR